MNKLIYNNRISTPLSSQISQSSNPSLSPPPNIEAPPDPRQQQNRENVHSPRVALLMPEICRPIFSKKFFKEILSAQICDNLEENSTPIVIDDK